MFIALLDRTNDYSGMIAVLMKMKMKLTSQLLTVDVFVLWGFDLLKEFQVPELRGVQRVDGSGPAAVAYRLNPSIHLRRSTRSVQHSSSECPFLIEVLVKRAHVTPANSLLWFTSLSANFSDNLHEITCLVITPVNKDWFILNLWQNLHSITDEP